MQTKRRNQPQQSPQTFAEQVGELTHHARYLIAAGDDRFDPIAYVKEKDNHAEKHPEKHKRVASGVIKEVEAFNKGLDDSFADFKGKLRHEIETHRNALLQGEGLKQKEFEQRKVAVLNEFKDACKEKPDLFNAKKSALEAIYETHFPQEVARLKQDLARARFQCTSSKLLDNVMTARGTKQISLWKRMGETVAEGALLIENDPDMMHMRLEGYSDQLTPGVYHREGSDLNIIIGQNGTIIPVTGKKSWYVPDGMWNDGEGQVKSWRWSPEKFEEYWKEVFDFIKIGFARKRVEIDGYNLKEIKALVLLAQKEGFHVELGQTAVARLNSNTTMQNEILKLVAQTNAAYEIKEGKEQQKTDAAYQNVSKIRKIDAELQKLSAAPPDLVALEAAKKFALAQHDEIKNVITAGTDEDRNAPALGRRYEKLQELIAKIEDKHAALPSAPEDKKEQSLLDDDLKNIKGKAFDTFKDEVRAADQNRAAPAP